MEKRQSTADIIKLGKCLISEEDDGEMPSYRNGFTDGLYLALVLMKERNDKTYDELKKIREEFIYNKY